MANQGLTGSSNGAIPPAPSFADFRFSTIGQEPPLLRRVSSQTPDAHSLSPSSPVPGELDFSSAVEPLKPLPRPTLLRSSTYLLNSSGNDAAGPDTCTASRSPDARDSCFAEPHLLPLAQIVGSSRHTPTTLSTVCRNFIVPDTATSTVPAMFSSQKQLSPVSASPSEMVRTPGVYFAPTAKYQAPLPAATMHQTRSSYAALRTLQERLMTSLSKLHPPDMTNVLLCVQKANSHSVNALTAAHRSCILAQQSLVAAQEAVTAAQECLHAAEQARMHGNDALTTVRQLHSGKVNLNAGGITEWEWKVNFIQLQDDLRTLGEWLVEKESEDVPSFDAQPAHTRDKSMAEAVRFTTEVSDSDSIVKDRSSEVFQPAGVVQNRKVEASRVIPHSDLPSYRNLDHKEALELEADIATKAWSSEQSHAFAGSPLITRELSTPKGDRDMPQEAQQSAKFNETLSLSSEHQDTLVHLPEDKVRTQVRHEETQSSKLHEMNMGVASFQELQREHVTSEREVVPTETSKHERQSHRALEESNLRQLDEREKKEEQLSENEEQELIAEQERRRQQVMAQKQRATAEIAARINAQRAREREKAIVASLQSPTSSTLQSSLPDCPIESENFVPEMATPLELSKDFKSLSGGDKSGPATNEQPQLTKTSNSPSQLSPVAGGSAALCQPSLKSKASGGSAALCQPSFEAKASMNRGLETTKSDNFVSSAKSSQYLSMITFRTPTPTNGIHGGEKLHTYRHSNDPGNLCLVPRSQVIPVSPEVQVSNLRFLKKGNNAHPDISTLLDLKPDPENLDQSSLHQQSPIKNESPIPGPLVEPQTQSRIEPEPSQDVSSSPSSLPVKKHFPSASLLSMRRPASNQDISVDQHGVKGITEVAHASSTNGNFAVVSSSNAQRPLSNLAPPNPHRDDLSSLRNNSKSFLASKPQNLPLTTPIAPRGMISTDPNFSGDGTPVAPVIHANGGWARPVDKVHPGDFMSRELAPPRHPRQFSGGDKYYSPPRAPTPSSYASRGYATGSISTVSHSPLLPANQSSPLGKRRQREDVLEDEHPPRRHWPNDGTRRTRSPLPNLRQSAHGRFTSPDCRAHRVQVQDSDHSDKYARPPLSRELARRSPSPNRPALQARIGGGQSYRPTYSSDVSERTRPWTRDNYSVRQVEQSAPGHRLGTESGLRGPYSHRSRGSMSYNRLSPRRSYHGGYRSLNLEQRIASSAKPLTLIHRLESPQRD